MFVAGHGRCGVVVDHDDDDVVQFPWEAVVHTAAHIPWIEKLWSIDWQNDE